MIQISKNDSNYKKYGSYYNDSDDQLCGSEVTQVTLLSCNYFASFHKDTVTSYIITFITRGEFFLKGKTSARNNFGI